MTRFTSFSKAIWLGSLLSSAALAAPAAGADASSPAHPPIAGKKAIARFMDEVMASIRSPDGQWRIKREMWNQAVKSA